LAREFCGGGCWKPDFGFALPQIRSKGLMKIITEILLRTGILQPDPPAKVIELSAETGRATEIIRGRSAARLQTGAFQFFDDLFRPKGFRLQRQRRGPAKAQGNALGVANPINLQSAESAAQPLFGLNNASFPP
jgi:hypothetical protein